MVFQSKSEGKLIAPPPTFYSSDGPAEEEEKEDRRSRCKCACQEAVLHITKYEPKEDTK